MVTEISKENTMTTNELYVALSNAKTLEEVNNALKQADGGVETATLCCMLTICKIRWEQWSQVRFWYLPPVSVRGAYADSMGRGVLYLAEVTKNGCMTPDKSKDCEVAIQRFIEAMNLKQRKCFKDERGEMTIYFPDPT